MLSPKRIRLLLAATFVASLLVFLTSCYRDTLGSGGGFMDFFMRMHDGARIQTEV